MCIGKLAAILLSVTFAASAQHLSVGLVGGVPLTGGLSDSTQQGVDTLIRTYSESKEYVVGPMVDVRLPLSLGIEVDALYRPISFARDFQVIPGPSSHTVSTPGTWEFPVLGKYRLPLLPIIKPFVEAGPSFRARDSSISSLSKNGVTIGGGVEVKILKLRISPAIRYTRWGSDAQGAGTVAAGTINVNPAAVFLFPPSSNQNQAEFLVGFSF